MPRVSALFASLVILTSGMPAFAQDWPTPLLADSEMAVSPAAPEVLRRGLWTGSPALGLATGESFSFLTSFGWTYPSADFLPSISARNYRSLSRRSRRALEEIETSELDPAQPRKRPLFYTSGEVDFMYAKATGRYGGELKRAYVIGEIGNEHFRFSVGVSHSEWSFDRDR